MNKEFRLDHFLIWGHGVRFLTGIMDTINEHSDVDILWVEKKKISDMKVFIDQVYSSEWPSVPKEHTLSKTSFLLNPQIPNEAAIILVMNRNPNVRTQDNIDPRFRMPESGTIKDIKTKIREKFDPNKGGGGLIPLLSGYNPDQHIVHASDFEEQVHNILSIFNMKKYNSWFKYWEDRYQPTSKSNILTESVRLDNILLRILDNNGNSRICKIEDSPHYKFLCGDTIEYENYWEQYSGTMLKEDHSPATFNKLAEDFNYLSDPYENCYIKVDENYKSLDGDHRLTILKSQGVDTVKVEVCNGA